MLFSVAKADHRQKEVQVVVKKKNNNNKINFNTVEEDGEGGGGGERESAQLNGVRSVRWGCGNFFFLLLLPDFTGRSVLRRACGKLWRLTLRNLTIYNAG